ncbi:NUDIX domain-containing protein [Roseibium sp. RKSG952]|nr:NUDIX domain-containing protein [Roseibium sp. RKSG952]
MSTNCKDAGKNRVVIKSTEVLADNWGKLTRYELSYRRQNGAQQELSREVYDHGDGAAVLPYNSIRGTVILTRQWRLPPHLAGYEDGLIEVCAGLLDEDNPVAAIRREAEEEIRMSLGPVEHVGTFFMTPGSVGERLHCFIAPYEGHPNTEAIGGVESEGEEISILEFTLAETLQMIEQGAIMDAKTVILLQHLALKTLTRSGVSSVTLF